MGITTEAAGNDSLEVSAFRRLHRSGRLPTPSGVALRILQITMREDGGGDELAEVVAADPALSGRLLKLANAVAGGARSPVTTGADATLRLGAQVVRNVALGFSLVSGSRTYSCPAFDYEAHWRRSLGRAVGCQMLSCLTGVGRPAEEFTLGLLSEMGYLAFASVFPESYSHLLEELARAGAGWGQLASRELQSYGIDHTQLTAAMLTDWGLPPRFGEAVDRAESLAPRHPGESPAPGPAELLHGADILSRALVAGDDAAPEDVAHLAAGLEALRAGLGLEREALLARCARLLEEWFAWGESLGLDAGSQAALPRWMSEETWDGAGAEDRKPLGPSVRPAPESSAPSDDDLIRVLVADDDPVGLEVVCRGLQREGIEVLRAPDGDEALRLALEELPDMIVADQHMPGRSGLELCRALRNTEYGKSVYFLLLTADDDEQSHVEGFEAGIDDFAGKPIAPSILAARLRSGERLVRENRSRNADISELSRRVAESRVLARKLCERALTDPLTGLPNRRHAMKTILREWQATSRRGSSFAAIVMDVDNFKRINDERGHDEGDRILRCIAQAARAVLREGEDLCRVGGEEFVVICSDADLEAAAACAERLRRAIEDLELQTAGGGHVTVSLGVAERCPGITEPRRLLKAADRALYRAKEQGRNRVCCAQESDDYRRSA